MRRHPGIRKFAGILIAAFALVACAAQASPALEMPGIPYTLQVPDELVPRLAATPLTADDGEFASSIFEAGGTSAVTVTYAPTTGADPSILMTVFWFPSAAFEAAQNPNEPPLFGTKVLERDGQVLAVAGPHDMMYEDEDGEAISTLNGLIYDAANWTASS